MTRASMRPFRAAALWAVALVFVAAIPVACTPGPREVVFQGATMGTTYSVKVAVHDLPGDTDLRQLHAALGSAIKSELDQVNALMSTYDPDSELSRFNTSREATPFQLSVATADVFSLALDVSRESNGACDITVGPLVNAWGFGPDGRPEKAPTPEDIEALRERVGYTRLTLDAENR
ncbi:MAG: hypothetical protein GY851_33585, partial [bacterium]|nr:hypothetical protein [bacterium]